MNFVLVPGAFHGGWAFRVVADRLRAEGHRVFTPTLTGLGERSHCLSKAVTLETHFQDIANVLIFEDLTDVILVGHSYGGIVISGANEMVPERIAQLIFLDAMIPEQGKTGLETVDAEFADRWREDALENGDGWLNRADEKKLDLWGVEDPAQRAFLLSKLTDFSLPWLETPVNLTAHFDRADKRYIRCTQHSYTSKLLKPFYEKAMKENWPTVTVPTCHEPMITAPAMLTATLLQLCL